MKKYKAISCQFYDYLLETITLKKSVNLEYLTDKGKTIKANSILFDVFTKDGGEYLKLSDSTIIRLDHILEINGKLNNQSSCSIN